MKKAAKICLTVIGIVLLIVVGLLIFLSVTEYRPDKKELVNVKGNSVKNLTKGDTVAILTYNIGYGALSKSEDFFMDGGKKVRPDSEQVIENNIKGIKNQIKEQNVDVVFFQEVDQDSKRSYHVNEAQSLWEKNQGNMAFAPNFVCKYVPYPFPPIGKVYGGIMTVNKYDVINAERVAFPSSFHWPVSMCNLKRCLLIERTPIAGTDKEMIWINLHLEAYDSGEGKKLQSKMLAKVMKAEYEKGNYVIAGGDFNQSFSCVDANKYPVKNKDYFVAGKLPEEYFGDEWQIVMDDKTPTSRLLNGAYEPNSEKTQYYMLDGFIVSPNLKIETLQTKDYGFTYTDHNPVKITVKLN